MQSDIQITNRNDTCFVDIEGVIGVPEEWQFDQPSSRVATYEKFRDSLDRLREIDAPEIVVNIRSTGGDVNDALLIYEALSSLDGHIVTRCYGYTASAATVIAQAASEGCREISAHALYLIHNSTAPPKAMPRNLRPASTCSAKPTHAWRRSMPPVRAALRRSSPS